MVSQLILDIEDYRILPATWHDVSALHRLEQLIFPQDNYLWLEMLWLLIWPGLVNLKAVTPEGTVTGFISGGRLWGGKMWIITLGVHPNHQRHGLGRRLLTICETRLDAPSIYLTARVSNTPALTLYRQQGYRQVRLRQDYYSGGETGVEMRKDQR